MTKKSYKPSDSEMEVLQLLWKHGAMTVREVHEKLNSIKDVGYTTTLKVMQRMLDKGILTREKTDRSHIYEAVIREEKTKSEMLDRFLHLTFGGSSLKMVLQAIDSKSTSKDDLKKIREYLDKIEKGEQ